jgi:FkbM family methyltransferase
MEKPAESVIDNIHAHLQDDLSREIFDFRLKHSLDIIKNPKLEGYENKAFSYYTHEEFLKWREFANRTDLSSTLGEIAAAKIPLKLAKSVLRKASGRIVFGTKRRVAPFEPSVSNSNEQNAAQPRRGIAYKALRFVFRKLHLHNAIANEYQYFTLPELYPFGKDEVFVDCGCFDGYTVKRFVKLSGGNYSRIYSFEPHPQQFVNCRKVLRNVPYVTVINAGVADVNGEIRFSDNGAGSRFDPNGDLRVKVVRLDDELSDTHVSFLKMDIEGMELAALRGARKLIELNKPRLAICVYHKVEDIWEIPKYILSLNPDYKFYLRHYPQNDYYYIDCDTVLHAV